VQQTSRSLNWILVRVARAFRDTLSATNACAKRPAHVRPPHTLPLLQLIVVRGQSSCTMAGEEGANQPCRLRGQPDGGAYYTATVFIWLYAARGCIGARLSGSAASARRMGACRALRRGVAAPAGINGMKGGAGDDVEMPETPPTPVKPAPAPPPTRWQVGSERESAGRRPVLAQHSRGRSRPPVLELGHLCSCIRTHAAARAPAPAPRAGAQPVAQVTNARCRPQAFKAQAFQKKNLVYFMLAGVAVGIALGAGLYGLHLSKRAIEIIGAGPAFTGGPSHHDQPSSLWRRSRPSAAALARSVAVQCTA